MAKSFLNMSFALIALTLVAWTGGCKPANHAKPGVELSAGQDHAESSHGGSGSQRDHSSGHAEHGDQSATTVRLIRDDGWQNPAPGKPLTLRFHLEDSGKPVQQFELVHERAMHFIAVRDGLDEFLHLHPRVTSDGSAEVEVAFPAPGRYWLYLDVKPVGSPLQTIRQELQVAGTPAPPQELKSTLPETIKLDGMKTRISLIKKDAESIVSFEHMTQDGSPIKNLQPYLGGMGHLVVVGAKSGEYVHAHPESESASDGKVLFTVHFKHPGLYKAWGQFQREGRVFTVPVVLSVEP